MRTFIVTAHLYCSYSSGKINSMSVSGDGLLLCTTSDDKVLKIFDVVNFGKRNFLPCTVVYSRCVLKFQSLPVNTYCLELLLVGKGTVLMNTSAMQT